MAAKVGCVVHPSLGIGSFTHRLGVEDRYRAGTWSETQIVWPAALMGQMLDNSFGSSGTLLVSYARDRRPQLPDGGEYHTSWFPLLNTRGRVPNETAFHEITDLEVGGTIILVSVKAGINPLEILDFLLGYVGLDIGKDDPKPENKPTMGPAVSPSVAASGGQ